MGTLTIKALGPLAEKIKTEQQVKFAEEISAFELVAKFGIPQNESRLSFVVNGKIQKGSYVLQNNDSIIVLKMGGAG